MAKPGRAPLTYAGRRAGGVVAVGEFRLCKTEGCPGWAVLGPDGVPVAPVIAYLEFLAARAFSPHTIRAYALAIGAAVA